MNRLAEVYETTLATTLARNCFSQSTFCRLNQRGLAMSGTSRQLAGSVGRFYSLFIRYVSEFFVYPTVVMVCSVSICRSGNPRTLTSICLFFFVKLILRQLVNPGLVQRGVVLSRLRKDCHFRRTLVQRSTRTVYLDHTAGGIRRGVSIRFTRIVSRAEVIL